MLARRGDSDSTEKKPAKKAARAEKTGKPARSRRKKGTASIKGLTAPEVTGDTPPADVNALTQSIWESGGGVVGCYRDPVGGHWHILASLPIQRVEPTPFQRDISKTHVERLGDVIGRMGRFLDPIIAVRTAEGTFWTPNGHHRLAAMRALGARCILAVVVPELSVAYQILAMNTEKGHNLREKSLEVIRMARSLAELDSRPEKDFALEFEEPAYLTLGLAYEKRGRLSGGAYHPVLKRVEVFLDEPLPDALRVRGELAEKLHCPGRHGGGGGGRPQGAGIHEPVPESVRRGADQSRAVPARGHNGGGRCAGCNGGRRGEVRCAEGEAGRSCRRAAGAGRRPGLRSRNVLERC